jgi:hypothetical protein
VRSIKHSNSPHSQASKACGLVTRTTRAAAERSDRTLSRLDSLIGVGILLWAVAGTAGAIVHWLVPPSTCSLHVAGWLRDAGVP